MVRISKPQAEALIGRAYDRLRNTSRETPNLIYHSVDHADDIRPWGQRIGYLSGVTGPELLEIDCALAWHDVGVRNPAFNPRAEKKQPNLEYDGHEMRGAREMRSYAGLLGVPDVSIENISGMIMATKHGAKRNTLSEKVAFDADRSSLGRPEGLTWAERLRQEAILNPNTSPFAEVAENPLKWYQNQVQVYEDHVWATPAAEQLFSMQEEVNLDFYRTQVKKHQLRERELKIMAGLAQKVATGELG